MQCAPCSLEQQRTQKAETSQKNSSSTPCHTDLRTISATIARARTQEERARDEMVEEEIVWQKREEQATAAWFQARKEKFATAADANINGFRYKDNHRKTKRQDVVMKDVGSSPHPGLRRGSKICKAIKTGRIDTQLIKQKCLAELAISLASWLKDRLGPHKTIIFGDPQPAVGGMSGQVATEITLLTATATCSH